MKILPWLAASAVDDPEMPAKKTDSSTLICASAPGKLPTIARESRTRRSVMPPTFIRLAVSRKNGTASRMNELYALNVVLNTTIGERRGSRKSTGRQPRLPDVRQGTHPIAKDEAQILDEPLAEEEHPGESCKRPRDEDVGHRHLR